MVVAGASAQRPVVGVEVICQPYLDVVVKATAAIELLVNGLELVLLLC